MVHVLFVMSLRAKNRKDFSDSRKNAYFANKINSTSSIVQHDSAYLPIYFITSDFSQ